jgi:uncharacterized OsmC-like protein
VVTSVGVAYRGQIPLQDIGVDFEVEPVTSPDGRGFGVRETVTLTGPLSETERLRLRRAVDYCPVGQIFTKGALDLQDEIIYRPEEAMREPGTPSAQGLPPSSVALPPVPPGAVHGRYLVDTKEYSDRGVLQHEGEVKLYLTCENLTRTGRWTLLAGHSSVGWMPPPVPLAYAALAASTVTTVRQSISAEARLSTDFHVEIAPHSAGNRDVAQTNAAAGTLNVRRVARKVVLQGSPHPVLTQAVEAALQQDLLAASFRKGGGLLSEQLVVRSSAST